MAFWDFLKHLLPEKFVDLTIDNRKVEITNSTVIIGNQTIEDPTLVDAIIKQLSDHKTDETLPVQIVHKELEEEYIEYERVSIDSKESIVQLRNVLPEEEVECILMARRVKLAYDIDLQRGRKLDTKFCERYPQNGTKVRNLISAGYFDEMIVPFIDVYKSEYDDSWKEEYRKFYFDIIKFFPLAVFVGNGTTEEKILHEITSRLELNVPFLRLHAIGSTNIKKIETVIAQLDIENKYVAKDKRFTSPSGLKAQIYEIKVNV